MREEHSDNFTRTAVDDELAVANLIGGLPKIEAPTDFDVKVRARIAERRSAAPKGIAWLRLALPVVGLALVAGIFLFASYWRLGDDLAVVAEPERIEPAPARPETPVVASNAPTANLQNVDRVAPANAPISTAPAASRPPEETNHGGKPSGPSEAAVVDDGAGSRDTSLRPPRSIEVPSEVRSSTGAASNDAWKRKERSAVGVSLVQALSFVGVRVESAGGQIVVSSVSPKGAGEVSGLRTGDVIEAVNDRPASATEEFSEIKTVTVSRGGQRIVLRLGQ